MDLALPRHDDRTVTAGLLVWAFALALCGAIVFRHDFMDDSFITFRYVANLLETGELVFNPGDRVEGLTNVGWALILAPLGWLVGVPTAAKALSLLLTTGVLYVLGRTIYATTGSAPWSAIAVAFMAVTPWFAYFMQSGMETPAAAILGIGLVLAVEDQRFRPALAIGLALALFLVRPECVIVLPVFLGLAWARGLMGWRDVGKVGAIYAVLMLAVAACRWGYYGSPFPNTLLAKPSAIGTALGNIGEMVVGNSANLPGLLQGILGLWALVFAGIVCALRGGGRELMAAAIVGSAAVFAIYTPEDWTKMPRYFVPAAPMCMILACYTIDLLKPLVPAEFPRWRSPDQVQVRDAAGLLFVAIANVYLLANVHGLMQQFVHGKQMYPGYVLFSKDLIVAAQDMAKVIPANAMIATRRIGVVSYYTKARVFDYKFGLVHRDIAQLISDTRVRSESPNDPRLASYWAKYQPDFVLEDTEIVEPLLVKGSNDIMVVQGQSYRIIKRYYLGTDGGKPAHWTLAQRVAG